MNGMQQTLLAMSNNITKLNKWDITTCYNVDTLRVDFTCHDSEQKNCFFIIEKSYTERLIRTLFSNLLDLHCGFIIEVPGGDLTKEKLNN